MKFLCLHGIGTNNQIFKMQTAAFRYELADQHTYEFVQGVVPWQLPTELATLSSLADEHYAYYDVTSPASFIAALQDLERYIEADGPFDGIVAYSQGAGLVAMLLVHKLNLQPEADCLFKCAILFSPLQVYDPAAYLERWGEVRVLDHLPPDMAALPIPVVIVYGEQDEKKHECIGVQALCNPDLLTVFVHEGGHEVPGIGLKHQILGTVNAARRGVTQAAMAAARC